jgi:hypothetical protein
MTTVRRFCCDDLLRFANVNVDHLTETVHYLLPLYVSSIAPDGVLFVLALIPKIQTNFKNSNTILLSQKGLGNSFLEFGSCVAI